MPNLVISSELRHALVDLISDDGIKKQLLNLPVTDAGSGLLQEGKSLVDRWQLTELARDRLSTQLAQVEDDLKRATSELCDYFVPEGSNENYQVWALGGLLSFKWSGADHRYTVCWKRRPKV